MHKVVSMRLSNLLLRARCGTESIFKRSTAGLNLKLLFSKIGCLTKAKEHSLTFYLRVAGGEKEQIHAFPKREAYSYIYIINLNRESEIY